MTPAWKVVTEVSGDLQQNCDLSTVEHNDKKVIYRDIEHEDKMMIGDMILGGVPVVQKLRLDHWTMTGATTVKTIVPALPHQHHCMEMKMRHQHPNHWTMNGVHCMRKCRALVHVPQGETFSPMLHIVC